MHFAVGDGRGSPINATAEPYAYRTDDSWMTQSQMSSYFALYAVGERALCWYDRAHPDQCVAMTDHIPGLVSHIVWCTILTTVVGLVAFFCFCSCGIGACLEAWDPQPKSKEPESA